MTHNTRFAPSPTGNLHLGGARTAMFNWLPARITGGKFILRIDDTDTVRSKDAYVDDILRGIDFLGLDYDALYRQSDRLDLYRGAIDKLISNGHAVMGDDGSVRLSLSDNIRLFKWFDKVVGEVPIGDDDWNYIKTAVISRTGNMPLYNLASIVDDIDMGVNLIVRGVDHIKNTAIQHVILWLLAPDHFVSYAHVGLIHGADGKKMSKRDGDDSFLLSHYVDTGYRSDAMFNCLLRLGWAPKVDDKSTAVLTRDDAMRLFLNDGNLRASSAKFDLAKLDAWNRKYTARAKA